MKKVTNKKFDNIFTGIMVIGFLIFAFCIGGFSGVVDAVFVFIKESFKIFICIAIVIVLCIFFPKIRNLFDKKNN